MIKPLYSRFPGKESHPLFLSIIVFILATWPQDISALQEPTEEQVMNSLAYRVFITIIAIILAWIARGFLLRKLSKLMMSESRRAETITEIPVQEVGAVSELIIKEISGKDEFPEAETMRVKKVKEAKRGFIHLFLAYLIATFGYTIFYFMEIADSKQFALSQLYLEADSLTVEQQQMYISVAKTMSLYEFLLIGLIIWNVMRFIGNYHQFRAYSSGAFGTFKPIWKMVFFPFQDRWCRFLIWVMFGFTLILAPTMPHVIYLPLLVLAIHLLAFYFLRKKGRERDNLKLLILRVFMIGKTSHFTLKNLVKFWKHFGTYFTVGDPSFYKVNWKRIFNYNFPIYILLTFFLYTLASDPNKEQEGGIFTGFIFLLVVFNIIALRVNLTGVKRNFMNTTDELKERLSKLKKWPLKYDGSFKEMPVMCYDNTWKQAVDTLINTADVVLMDLRGFSESNKGCEYEVGELFDHVPVDKIMFLGFPSTVPLIRDTLSKQWNLLKTDSPNLKISQPVVRLFVVEKENDKETQSILDLLLLAASTSDSTQ